DAPPLRREITPITARRLNRTAVSVARNSTSQDRGEVSSGPKYETIRAAAALLARMLDMLNACLTGGVFHRNCTIALANALMASRGRCQSDGTSGLGAGGPERRGGRPSGAPAAVSPTTKGAGKNGVWGRGAKRVGGWVPGERPKPIVKPASGPVITQARFSDRQ